MGKTKIDWCDKVWNPVTGCTKVSEGCRNCYAERMSKRLAGRAGYPEEGFKVTLHPERLDEPLRWKKPSRIFVCSMGDLFHKDVPDSFLEEVYSTMVIAAHHTFLILTKRPKRMFSFITSQDWERVGSLVAHKAPLAARQAIVRHKRGERIFHNIFLGVSVENQKTADERIPLLLNTPAVKRFVSYEPGLGPVDFCKTPGIEPYQFEPFYDALKGRWRLDNGSYLERQGPKLDWIIMGGESGPGARPMHPDWARSVRNQFAETNTPFFFKQWGEWAPGNAILVRNGAEFYEVIDKYPCHKFLPPDETTYMHRVGKARAGCLLDGKEHKEMP